jgi:hypothetical protein
MRGFFAALRMANIFSVFEDAPGLDEKVAASCSKKKAANILYADRS